MDKIKFKIWDRVKLTKFSTNHIKFNLVVGATGTIMERDDIPFVMWDKPEQNHSMYGTAIRQSHLTLIP